MKLCLFIFFLLLVPLLVLADTPITNQSRFSFETGTEWQYVDTTSLLSSTEGSLISSWSLSASDATNRFKYSTTRPYNLPRRYTVDGATTNAADTGTRDLVVIMEVATAERYIQANLASNQGKLAGGFSFENTFTTADFSNCDFFKFHNGVADAVIQFRSYSPLAYRTHTGSPSLVGPDVAVTSSQTNVWITFKFDNSSGVTNFSFSVYDRDTRTLIGESSLALTGASYPDVADIRISNDSHSSASVQRTNRVDNFLLTTNVSAYPIIPWLTNVYYVDKTNGSDSNSGRSEAKAWATIGKAASTLVAGETAYVSPGSYDETVSETTDGTQSNPIRYIGGTNVIVRGFSITGDYIEVLGFKFTAFTSNTNLCPMVLNGSTGSKVLNNWFIATGHATSGGEGGAIKIGLCTNIVVRGNVIEYAGTNGAAAGGDGWSTARYGKDLAGTGDNAGSNPSDTILWEYNTMRHSAEYMNPGGVRWLIRNNVMGPTTTNDWYGAPHIDGLQANELVHESFITDQWHVENPVHDSHFFLTQYGHGWKITLLNNVSIRSGDYQVMWMGLLSGGSPADTNLLSAHMVVGESSVGGRTPEDSYATVRTLGSSTPFYFNNSSNNVSRNNIFTNVTTSSSPYTFATGGSATTDHDIMYPQGTSNATLNVSNPLFTDYAGRNLIPQSSSPAVDAAGALTTTVGTGSGSSIITVVDAQWFHDGFGLTVGSKIYVGGDNNLTVTDVNYSANTITIETTISWGDGESVGLAYRGGGPDIGAYEYGDTLLTSATIASNTTTPFPVYTVTPVGDARFVQFYADGVPVTPDYDSPYTYTVTAGETVTATVFALRSQATNVVSAELDSGGVTTNWYVSTSGNDSNVGTEAAPFLTLAAAQTAARAEGSATYGANIYVRGGTYYQTTALALTTADNKMVWTNYPGETPVLVGGLPITNWQTYSGDIKAVNVSTQGFGSTIFRQLFFGTNRQWQARYPNYDTNDPYGGGWSYTAGTVSSMNEPQTGESQTIFTNVPGDIKNGWSNITNATVFIFPRYNWWNNIINISNTNDSRVTLKANTDYTMRHGDRYYVQNVFEELDAPGEWYLNTNSMLYFWPTSTITDGSVVAPLITNIVTIATGATNIGFYGFTLRCSEGTAITLTTTTNCLIARNTILNVGDYTGSGISVSGGLSNQVFGNDISHVGKHGIVITGGTTTTLVGATNSADNNYIHHTGVYHKEGVGVHLMGVGNRARANTIHKCPRFGIYFRGQNLTIESNVVHDVMKETDDGGIIYSENTNWLESRGCTVRYNYFYDALGWGFASGVRGTPEWSYGIYLDGLTCGVDVIGNVVARTSASGFFFNGGSENRITNNVFFNCEHGPGTIQGNNGTYFRAFWHTNSDWTGRVDAFNAGWATITNQAAWNSIRGMGYLPQSITNFDGTHTSASNYFIGNINRYSDTLNPTDIAYYVLRLENTRNKANSNISYNGNTFYATHYPDYDRTWAQWQAAGWDVNGSISNPLLVDPVHGNFQLDASSPALAMGITSLDVSVWGAYDDPLRASWPLNHDPAAVSTPSLRIKIFRAGR